LFWAKRKADNLYLTDMKHHKPIIFLLLLCGSVKAQLQLTASEKDSLATLVCKMEQADQEVRNNWEKAKAAKDSIAMKIVAAQWLVVDSTNFATLFVIVRDLGYPCQQLLGKSFHAECNPSGVLIHWMKARPEWFCSKTMIPLFRREIENGHIPLPIMDFCFFSYVSYMKADPKLMAAVNEARTAYGLRAYTKKQYTQQEYMEPLMTDDDASRRKLGIRIKQEPERFDY